MRRSRSLVAGLLVLAGVVAGAGIATIVPPISAANANEPLTLAPGPTGPGVAMPSFADLAERAIPSVVAITSEKMVDARDPHDFMDNPFFRRFFRGEPFGEDESTPPGGGNGQRQRRQKKMWGGSGFFITTNGYILTNKHVVEDAETLYVRTPDMDPAAEPIKARMIGSDPYLDLALIKVDGRTNWPALPLGDSETIRVGDWSVAIGNPIMFRDSVTVGVISGKQRRLEIDPSNLGDYIQTDAAINFGNSGGPLLNARGEVIGINTAIIRDDPTSLMNGGNGYIQGIGFALPITPVKRVLNQIATTGTVKRGYLGVSVQAMTLEKAEYFGLPKGETRGAYVQRVDRGTPAYEAGVRQDDVILAVDGRPVNSSEELVNLISSHQPNEKVKLSIWRDRKRQDITVTLAERTVGVERPETGPGTLPAPDDSTASGLGFSVGPVNPALERRLQQLDPPVRGVLVTDVDPASEAATKGIAEGQVLVEIGVRQNGRDQVFPTATVEAYRKAVANVKAGEIVRLRIVDRNGDEATVFFRAPATR